MQHEPSLAGQRAGAAAILLFLVALLAVAGILLMSAMMFPLMIVPVLAILGCGVFVFVSALRGNAALRREALVRVPARVADERTEVLLGDEVSGGTHYYVSLEGERGGRVEYEVEAKVAGRVAPGDVGVAYFKGPFLVDFRGPGA